MQLHRIKKKYVKCNCGAEMLAEQSEKVNKKNSAILPCFVLTELQLHTGTFFPWCKAERNSFFRNLRTFFYTFCTWALIW